VQALTYRAFEPFVLVAAIYYVIVMALVAVGKRVERHVRRMQSGS
jgi:polar amino acid transport system permease protein